MSDGSTLRVVIVSPLKGAVSETFIRAHVDGLPFEVIPRYGSHWRLSDPSDREIWPWGSGLSGVLRRMGASLDKSVLDIMVSQHLRSVGADAVLAEYGITGSYLTAGCRKAGVPLFVHFHGFDASMREVLEEQRTGYQAMFDYADGIVAVSSTMKTRLISLGAKPERVHLNVYGVDPSRFSGGAPEAARAKFVAVGRFVEKKAPQLTLLAFKEVLTVVPDAVLTFVGEGPLLGPCRRLATALGLDGAVEFVGSQPGERVGQLMREARAFVQHSLEAESGDSEGTPVAVIEAQMTGLPVVSTRHAGIPDVVVDGETGFLVDEGDAGAMGVRMVRLALDPLLAGKMGRAGRARAATHFTLDRHLGQLAAMINGSVGAGRR